MAVDPNINLGEPPHQTPITSISYMLATPWVGWFNQVRRMVGQVPQLQGLASLMVQVGGGTVALTTYYTPNQWPRFFYYQTDRTVWYQSILISNVWTWRYAIGTYRDTLANKPTLGANDAGFLFYVTDYDHTLRWTGSAWTYADGGDRAGYIEQFLVDPLPTTGWALCDGTANVAYLKADGTTGTQSLPDLTSASNKAAVVKLGQTASATVNAANAPGSTAPTGAFTGTPATLTGNIGAPNSTTSLNAVAPTTAVGDGVHTHNLTMNSFTPSGTVAITGGVADATGQMQNIVLRPWFRK